MSHSEKVTLLGTGTMGSAVAAELVKKGFEVTVWNRNKERAAKIQGCHVASSVVEAVKASPDFVIVTLLGDKELETPHKILKEAENELKGKLIIFLSSSEPDAITKLAKWAESAGIKFVTAAMMCFATNIGKPDGLFLVSGPQAYFNQAKSVFDAVSVPVYAGEAVGLASLYDMGILLSCFLGIGGRVYTLALIKDYPGASLDYYIEFEKQLLPTVLPVLWNFQNNVVKTGDCEAEVSWMPLAGFTDTFYMYEYYFGKVGIKTHLIEAYQKDCNLVPQEKRLKVGPTGYLPYLKSQK